MTTTPRSRRVRALKARYDEAFEALAPFATEEAALEPFEVHCAVCDGAGHGQPGYGPCPLEEDPRAAWADQEDRERALAFSGERLLTRPERGEQAMMGLDLRYLTDEDLAEQRDALVEELDGTPEDGPRGLSEEDGEFLRAVVAEIRQRKAAREAAS